MRPIVLAMTGGSGAPYGARLLQMLLAAGRDVHLVISPAGAQVIRQELNISLPPPEKQITPEECSPLVDYETGRSTAEDAHLRAAALESSSAGRLTVHGHRDYFTPIASGSFLTAAMVICPCSGGTLSSIVRSAGSNLIERAAEVHVKERRKLIIVNRETPLSTFQLENMLRASQAGIVVLPAMPGWYHGVQNPADLVDFVVARILDQLDVPHRLIQRWQASDQIDEE
ncbi:MAG: flavin prenyltransferase UbiX [Pirellulales bacterium]